MTQPELKNDNLRCPDCGSHNTQPASVAYSQSLRIGQSGRSTVSGFGQLLQPPTSKDEKFLPGVAACIGFAISLFKLPDLLNHTSVSALNDLSPFSWQNTLLSCIVGWSIGLAFAIPAIRYNLHVLPNLEEKWERQAVCRRCGHSWQRREPGTVTGDQGIRQ